MKNSNENSKQSLLKERRSLLQRMAAAFTFGGLLSPLAGNAANERETSDAAGFVSSVPYIGKIIMFGGNFAPPGWA